MHPRLPNLILSRSGLDRAAHRRGEKDLLERAWADPRTRVLAVAAGRVPVTTVEGGAVLRALSPAEVGPAPVGTWVFLGEEAHGVAHLAVPAPEPQDGWLGLRDLGALLDDTGAGQLTTAVALLNWHETHTHCPRCGAPTSVAQAGWLRQCEGDGSDHYPRTDPAVIMTVLDDDDRVLLARGPDWPVGRYSTLAGFVEPGESLESAVRREVAEEVGVQVGEVEYLGSQPWPFPSSLMLGFTARALTTDVCVDGVEVSEARWFTREQLAADIASGEVVSPPGISISQRLVELWFGGPYSDARQPA
jgi:NAD+ diphosphatase